MAEHSNVTNVVIHPHVDFNSGDRVYVTGRYRGVKVGAHISITGELMKNMPLVERIAANEIEWWGKENWFDYKERPRLERAYFADLMNVGMETE